MIFVNFLRIFAYGLHAKKSWHCYISSIFAFIIAPMFFTNLELVLYQKIVIFIATLLSFILFAPADTYKRPLVNDRHRKTHPSDFEREFKISVIYNYNVVIL